MAQAACSDIAGPPVSRSRGRGWAVEPHKLRSTTIKTWINHRPAKKRGTPKVAPRFKIACYLKEVS